MWNHTQNCSPSGDETSEPESAWRKDKIERSLDLSQYLKYLDNLFNQRTSEVDSSESDDEDRSQTFTEFRQPPVANQAHDRSHYPPGLLLGPSSNSGDLTGSNHVSSFKPVDNFHVESNISSSSLSSIDSGTSSLSLNLSSESYLDSLQGSKISCGANGVTKSSESKRGGDDDTSEDNDDKEKKSQKKKKAGKSTNEPFPRQNKPNSGGKGNGSKGGGGGSSSGGSNGGSGSSSDASGSSSGSSSTGNVGGGGNGSPGARNCSGVHQQTDNVVKIAKSAAGSFENNNNFDKNSANADLERALGIRDSTTDTLLTGSYADSFDTEESFHLNSILDSIPDDEDSFSDYISGSTTLHSTNSSPSSTSQSSTNPSGIATEIGAAVGSKFVQLSFSGRSPAGAKSGGKKRKLESNNDESGEKSSSLSDKQKKSRIELLNAKRRKIYINICRKDVIKAQRIRAAALKEAPIIRRKLAQMCARHVRKNAVQSQNYMKESVCKAQKLTREMETFWKLEKKMFAKRRDDEIISSGTKTAIQDISSAKGLELNKLVVLMEMFANKVLCKNTFQVNEETVFSSHAERSSVKDIIHKALNEHFRLTNILEARMSTVKSENADLTGDYQPYSRTESAIGFHMDEVNWLKKMYTSGRHGIIADQSSGSSTILPAIFLDYLSRIGYSAGPFLVISPASRVEIWAEHLSNLTNFCKLVVYQGTYSERKLLQRFESKTGIPSDSKPFICLTSYLNLFKDLKSFSPVKWQYLVLDDTQNMLSSSSRWMPILSFPARSKILVRSCGAVNSSLHLCFYLYFIMPTLFDSHQELSELLLNEFESPSILKEDCVPRLQNIVNNFTYFYKANNNKDRVSSSEDLHIDCFLTKRQRSIYERLRQNAWLEHVLESLDQCSPEKLIELCGRLASLIGLLKMACNHPDLVEGRFISTPHLMKGSSVCFCPKLGLLSNSITDSFEARGMIEGLFNIYSANNTRPCLNGGNACWAFTRLSRWSGKEIDCIFNGKDATRLNFLVNFESVLQQIQYDNVWRESRESKYLITYPSDLLYHSLKNSKKFPSLLVVEDSGHANFERRCTRLSTFHSIEARGIKSRSHWQFKRVTHEPWVTMYHSDLKFISPRVVASTVLSPHDSLMVCGSEFLSQLQSNRDYLFSDDGGFIANSGKLTMLDKLMKYVENLNRRVAIVSYESSNVDLIQDYLKVRKIKFVKIENEAVLKSERMFLLILEISTPKLDATVDSVVFFDQTSTEPDQEKSQVLCALGFRGNPSDVNCYRLVCRGTVEDYVFEIPETGDLGGKLMPRSYLKWLVKSLKGNCSLERNEMRRKNFASSSEVEVLGRKPLVNSINESLHPIDKQEEVPNLVSPSCSEKSHEIYVLEEEPKVTGLKKKDAFSLSFDEGYMGMSPDSYDEIKIKPDYEEHSFSNLKRMKVGRGSGKRGRPPSRAKLLQRERMASGCPTNRRGPGRPRLNQNGPLNQGNRGRKPGRPPLSKKAEAISSAISSLSTAQNLYGFYSSSDLELS